MRRQGKMSQIFPWYCDFYWIKLLKFLAWSQFTNKSSCRCNTRLVGLFVNALGRGTALWWLVHSWAAKCISLLTSCFETVALGWRLEEVWSCDAAVEVLLRPGRWLTHWVNSTTRCKSAADILSPNEPCIGRGHGRSWHKWGRWCRLLLSGRSSELDDLISHFLYRVKNEQISQNQRTKELKPTFYKPKIDRFFF